MSAPRGLAEPGDAELVAGVLAGDRDSFAAIYDRYADRLHDFCYSMLRDRQDAADATQDVFVLVAQRLAQLRDPQRLRPWLYAIARSEALRRIRARSRFSSDAEVADMADPASGPAQAAEQAELAKLVADAATGLSDRDRALLDLHLRQGLEGAELGEAMGTSASHAHVLLHRLREQVERSLGALLIARLGRTECTELDTLLADWDGRFSPLIRKRVARHVDRCEVCGARRRVVASPWALLATVPLVPAPAYLRGEVLDQVQLIAHAGDHLSGGGSSGGAGAAPPGGTDRWTRSPRTKVLTAAALVVVAVAGAVLVWQTGTGATDHLADEFADPALSAPTLSAMPAPTAEPPVEPGVADPATTLDEFAPPPADRAEDPPATVPPDGVTPPGTASPPTRDEPSAPDSRLTVSARQVELAPPNRTGSLVLTNPGPAPVRWSATASESWLVIDPGDGTLAGGQSAPVTLRSTVREGRAVVTFAWDGGTVEVLVTNASPVLREAPGESTPPPRPAPGAGGRRREKSCSFPPRNL